MPFHLKKVKYGWYVEDDQKRKYSKKPLPEERAKAQMRALYAMEKRKALQHSPDGSFTYSYRRKQHTLKGTGLFGDDWQLNEKAKELSQYNASSDLACATKVATDEILDIASKALAKVTGDTIIQQLNKAGFQGVYDKVLGGWAKGTFNTVMGRLPDFAKEKLLAMGAEKAFDDFIQGIPKSIADSIAKKINSKEQLAKVISDAFGFALKSARSLTDMGLPTTLNPLAVVWLAQYGDDVITNLQVRRSPIKRGLDIASGLILGGAYENLKKELAYDDMFHLSLIITHKNPKTGKETKSIDEKLAVPNLSDVLDNPDGAEFMEVPLSGKQLIVKDTVANQMNAMGEKFFQYNALSNNCQSYVKAYLDANSLMTPTLETFVYQDVSKLLKETSQLSQDAIVIITNLGALFDRALKGYGKKKDTIVMPKADFLKEHKRLIKILETAGKEGERQKRELKGETVSSPFVKGNGYIQSDLDFAVASYLLDPPTTIDGAKLVVNTPTLKLYKKGKKVIVSIRGTDPSDARDVKADLWIGLNKLQTSARFQDDLKTLREFQNRQIEPDLEYYGIGHSLGGAMLDQFLKLGMIQSGVSFNPAIQPSDMRDTSIKNRRNYVRGDPLYILFGQFAVNTDIFQPKARERSLIAILDNHFLHHFKRNYATREEYEAIMRDQFGMSGTPTNGPRGIEDLMGGGRVYSDEKTLEDLLKDKAFSGFAGDDIEDIFAVKKASKMSESEKKATYEKLLHEADAFERQSWAGLSRLTIRDAYRAWIDNKNSTTADLMTIRNQMFNIIDLNASKWKAVLFDRFAEAQQYDKSYVCALTDVAFAVMRPEDLAGKAAASAGDYLKNLVLGTVGNKIDNSWSLQQHIVNDLTKVFGDNPLTRTTGRLFGAIGDGFNQLFTGKTSSEQRLENGVNTIYGKVQELRDYNERKYAELLRDYQNEPGRRMEPPDERAAQYLIYKVETKGQYDQLQPHDKEVYDKFLRNRQKSVEQSPPLSGSGAIKDEMREELIRLMENGTPLKTGGPITPKIINDIIGKYEEDKRYIALTKASNKLKTTSWAGFATALGLAGGLVAVTGGLGAFILPLLGVYAGALHDLSKEEAKEAVAHAKRQLANEYIKSIIFQANTTPVDRTKIAQNQRAEPLSKETKDFLKDWASKGQPPDQPPAQLQTVLKDLAEAVGKTVTARSIPAPPPKPQPSPAELQSILEDLAEAVEKTAPTRALPPPRARATVQTTFTPLPTGDLTVSEHTLLQRFYQQLANDETLQPQEQIVFDRLLGRIPEARGKGKHSTLEGWLADAKMTKKQYLAKARAVAKKAGYDPQSVELSEDGIHKLMIRDESGKIVRYGRVGFGDFLLYTKLEALGKVPKGFAKQKRDVFQKSHSKIRGNWRQNRYSPNQLSLSILWMVHSAS